MTISLKINIILIREKRREFFMKACGVELKGSDAIICIMSKENNLYDIPHIRVQKISLDNAGDAEQVQKFQSTFAKLKVEH